MNSAMKKIFFPLLVCAFSLADSVSAQEEQVVRIESSELAPVEYEVAALLRVELMGDSIRFIASDGTVAAEVYKYDYVRLLLTSKQSEGFADPAGASPTLEARKIIYNGQVYILWGEKIYTLQGQEVK